MRALRSIATRRPRRVFGTVSRLWRFNAQGPFIPSASLKAVVSTTTAPVRPGGKAVPRRELILRPCRLVVPQDGLLAGIRMFSVTLSVPMLQLLGSYVVQVPAQGLADEGQPDPSPLGGGIGCAQQLLLEDTWMVCICGVYSTVKAAPGGPPRRGRPPRPGWPSRSGCRFGGKSGSGGGIPPASPAQIDPKQQVPRHLGDTGEN